MSMMNGSRESLSSDINVTPMIDVLLVLLIIFMVILPHHFWGEEAEIPIPTEQKDVQRPYEPVVIQLHDSGPHSPPAITINQQDVAWPDLDAKLHQVLAGRIERVAVLIGDPEIDFQYVADTVDTAHHAGAERVGLLGAKD
jgi:biopolymer transport protein TolR